MRKGLNFFDYSTFTDEEQHAIQQAAEGIRQCLKRTSENIIEIGGHLVQVKARLKHGQFGPWLEAEFNMSRDSAQRFMNVFKMCNGKNRILRFLQPTTLYILALPSTPDSVRDEVAEMVTEGGLVTEARVQEMRRKSLGNKETRSKGINAVHVAEVEVLPPVQPASESATLGGETGEIVIRAGLACQEEHQEGLTNEEMLELPLDQQTARECGPDAEVKGQDAILTEKGVRLVISTGSADREKNEELVLNQRSTYKDLMVLRKCIKTDLELHMENLRHIDSGLLNSASGELMKEIIDLLESAASECREKLQGF